MRRNILKHFLPAFAAAAMTATSFTSCRTSGSATSRQQAYADSVAYNVARLQMKHRKFVLTSSQITINHSPLLNVSDNTNFVLLDSARSVVQVSPGYGGGPNSVGGFTVTGDVTNFKEKIDKNGDVTITYRLSAPIGSSEVRILLYNGSNRAEATVNPTFYRGRATLYGTIKALDANYFEGRSF